MDAACAISRSSFGSELPAPGCAAVAKGRREVLPVGSPSPVEQFVALAAAKPEHVKVAGGPPAPSACQDRGMLRSVAITAVLALGDDPFHNLHWTDSFEFSIDCFVCKRTDRTTMLTRGAEQGICSGSSGAGPHPAATRISAFDDTSERERSVLHAVVDYWWAPFRDEAPPSILRIDAAAVDSPVRRLPVPSYERIRSTLSAEQHSPAADADLRTVRPSARVQPRRAAYPAHDVSAAAAVRRTGLAATKRDDLRVDRRARPAAIADVGFRR